MYFECLCHSTWRAKFNWKREFTIKTWLWTKYGLLCLSRSTFFIQGILRLISNGLFRWYDQVCLWKCKRNIRFFLIIATLVGFVFKCYCRNIKDIHPAVIAHRIPQIRFWFLHCITIASFMASASSLLLHKGTKTSRFINNIIITSHKNMLW